MMILISVFFFLFTFTTYSQENRISDSKFIIKKTKKKELFDIDRFYFFPPLINFPSDPILIYQNQEIQVNFKPYETELKILKAKNLHFNNNFKNLISGGLGYENNFGMIAVCNITLYNNFRNILHSYLKTCINYPGSKKIDLIFDNELIIKKFNSNFGIHFEKKEYKKLTNINYNLKSFKNILSKHQYFSNIDVFFDLNSDFDRLSLIRFSNEDIPILKNLYFNFQNCINYNFFSVNNKENIGKIEEQAININIDLVLDDRLQNITIKSIHECSVIKRNLSNLKINDSENKELDTNYLFKIGPKIEYPFNSLLINAGIIFYIHNLTELGNRFKFSPYCFLNYKFNDYLFSYFKLKFGKFRLNTFKNIYQKNPLWLANKKNCNFDKIINQELELELGLFLKPIQHLTVDLKINSEKYNNFYFFKFIKNDYKILNTELLILKPEIEINIKNKLDTILFNININYLKYLDFYFKPKKVLYEPKYNFNCNVIYNYLDKIFIKNGLKIAGGRESTFNTSLDTIIDYGIGITYIIINNFYLDIEIENILLKNNEIFDGLSNRNFKITFSLGYKY